MKMKSIAGIICYAQNIEKTAAFYEALGFQFVIRDPDGYKLVIFKRK